MTAAGQNEKRLRGGKATEPCGVVGGGAGTNPARRCGYFVDVLPAALAAASSASRLRPKLRELAIA